MLLFGLIRIAVVAITVGTALAFVFGLWLVHEAGYGYADGWVIAAIVLLIVANAIGGIGRQARRGDRQARTRARRLGRRAEPGAAGPRPRPDLARAQLRQRPRPDRRARADGLEAGRMMLALIRPDSWNLPLFLHILGATVLFGTVATVAIAGFASRSRAGYEQLLARVARARSSSA